ncbi:hypothetical protein B0H66DRAFT_198864 [Apodospora peruviana]|uniref:Uncharacterized protein n=1 Tax=Apodospora peruviana TaxID=516989 RepID=A0AAE0M7N2_9PEZI|nr:hypothetical protein B0H66DRAFT_198864 [Apodospora peruviana]
MPPVPVYTKSPINAAKPDGVTPKTAAPEENISDWSNLNAPATTTTASSNIYSPFQPTPTTKTPGNVDGPPPPQPGAVPHAPAAATQTAMPPPPRAGESYHAQGPPAPAPTQAPQYPPPQMTMSMPEPMAPQSYRGTATATAAPASSTGGGSLAHPPGYQQQDFNASSPYADQYHQRPDDQSHGNGSTRGMMAGTSNDDEDDEGGVLSSAMKWAQAAGGKLSAAESEVWRRINGKE